MELISGKFYENGKEVPLEFGNPAQIALLKKAEEASKSGSLIDLSINEKSTYTMSMSWECTMCNHKNHDEDWEEFEDWEPTSEDEQEYIGQNLTCGKCGQEHELVVKKNGYRYEYYAKVDIEG